MPRLPIITERQRATMRVLAAGGLSTSAIAARLEIDTPAASRVVSQLLQLRLVPVAQNPADRRSNIVSITRQGRAFL